MAMLFQLELAGQTSTLAIANRYFYVLEDGSFLPIRVWPAWCEHCEKFTPAEQIFPIAEEARELCDVEYFAEHPGLIPPDRHTPIRQIPELRLRNRWRAQRVSSEKCLACGSTQVTMIWPGLEVDIPGRGKCVASFRGWADMSGPPDLYYSPEGDRLEFSLDR